MSKEMCDVQYPSVDECVQSVEKTVGFGLNILLAKLTTLLAQDNERNLN